MFFGQLLSESKTKSLFNAYFRANCLSKRKAVLFEGMIFQIITVEILFEYTQKGLRMVVFGQNAKNHHLN